MSKAVWVRSRCGSGDWASVDALMAVAAEMIVPAAYLSFMVCISFGERMQIRARRPVRSGPTGRRVCVANRIPQDFILGYSRLLPTGALQVRHGASAGETWGKLQLEIWSKFRSSYAVSSRQGFIVCAP